MYQKNKELYKNRLQDFKNIWKDGSNEDIHAELSFCILTPQSKALKCMEGNNRFKRKQFAFFCKSWGYGRLLNIVRFKNNKSRYLVELGRKMMDKNKKIITKDFFEAMTDTLQRENG